MEINEACVIVDKLKDQVWCGTDDLDTTIRLSREKEALETVLKYCVDTVALYEAFATERGLAVCITCKNNADNMANGTRCPIQEQYTLPKNGYCHLWEPREERPLEF